MKPTLSILVTTVILMVSFAASAQDQCSDLFAHEFHARDVISFRSGQAIPGYFNRTGSHRALRRGALGVPHVQTIQNGSWEEPEIHLISPAIRIVVGQVGPSRYYNEVEFTGPLVDVIRQIMRVRSDAYDRLGPVGRDQIIQNYTLPLYSDISSLLNRFPLAAGEELPHDIKVAIANIYNWEEKRLLSTQRSYYDMADTNSPLLRPGAANEPGEARVFGASSSLPGT